MRRFPDRGHQFGVRRAPLQVDGGRRARVHTVREHEQLVVDLVPPEMLDHSRDHLALARPEEAAAPLHARIGDLARGLAHVGGSLSGLQAQRDRAVGQGSADESVEDRLPNAERLEDIQLGGERGVRQKLGQAILVLVGVRCALGVRWVARRVEDPLDGGERLVDAVAEAVLVVLGR
eukprot:203597-Prymnesium_polylepis.1